MKRKGDTWNESQTHKDPVTGRTVRQITTAGDINEKAPYHTRTTFTDDGEFLIFSTLRDGASALCRAHVATGEITQLTDRVPSTEKQISARTIAPRSGWIPYWLGGSLRAVNIHTLQERTIIEDIGPQWSPRLSSVDPEEEFIVTPIGTEDPAVLASIPADVPRVYPEAWPSGRCRITRIIRVPFAGGEPEVIHTEVGININHLEHCPTDGDLLYIDRDRPPMWHAGGDYSKTSRCWTLRISTGELTPLTPRAEAKFQIHAVWSWDGQFIFYHGPAVLVRGPCPWYVGAVRPNGEIYREWTFQEGKHYGHVAAAPDRPAIILDGNVTPDRLVWLYIDGPEPRFETICEHKTELNSLPANQATHAHPSTDRSGRWIAYNVARAGRTDVHVVEV